MIDASIVASVGETVEDAAEETFVLFSQDIPSNDLGMLDSKARHIEVEIAGQEYEIQQSSGLLKSTREAGTTGAMIWKVTPLVADWLARPCSVLWSTGILTSSSNIVELGCGVAGLIGLALSPLVASYVLTDQQYVMKLLRENISVNRAAKRSLKKGQRNAPLQNNLHTLPLDWETDSVQNLVLQIPNLERVDVLVLCDCIYNTFLIPPLLQTCIDICRMSTIKPTILLIAQQLRSEDVFEEWMSLMLRDFVICRVDDKHLPESLRSTSGYVVHLAILRDSQTCS